MGDNVYFTMFDRSTVQRTAAKCFSFGWQNAGRKLTIRYLFYFYTERSVFRANAIYLTVFALALYKLNEHFAR